MKKNKPILGQAEMAVIGQQLQGGILWDAVFKRTKDGCHELLALVDRQDVAEILIDALNKQGKTTS